MAMKIKDGNGNEIDNMIRLLTTDACPKCPIAKEMMDLAKLEYIPLTGDEAIEEATRYGITTVPTIIDDYDQIYCGINEIQRFINKKIKTKQGPDGAIVK